MSANIPETEKKRVVIIGGGFAGLQLAKSLDSRLFQIVLVDKVNYHQFQPLLYQVTSSGLEPSAIAFPFRKNFQNKKDFYFRLASVTRIATDEKVLETSIGAIKYDYLVIATGTDTNYFGMQNVRAAALPMKSVSEALALRNRILENLEHAVTATDPEERQALLNIVIVGGGATGVEVAGALSEMKRYIFNKDYPDLDTSKARIILIEGSDKLLRNMSEEASSKAFLFLKQMGVEINLQTVVVDYKDYKVVLKSGDTIPTKTLIWVSGVTGKPLPGIHEVCYGRGGRILVDAYNRVNGYQSVFAIGDISLQTEELYPVGHPQVAQVAIQQGKLLAKNLINGLNDQPLTPFHYQDKGSMATVGRNRAIVDLHQFRFQGLFAWMVWMIVHLLSILGVKNKIQIVINWFWSYVTYDQSLRLIIRPDDKTREKKDQKDDQNR